MKAKWILVVVLLLMLPFASASAEICTVENDTLLLTVDAWNLDMTLTHKPTGQVLYSGVDAMDTGANESWQGFLASSLVLDVAEGTAMTPKNYDIHTSNPEISLTPVENGVDAVVDFTAIGQRISLQIRLEGDSLAITVPADGVTEYGETRLCGLYLLPSFGATHLDEEKGYIFVPEAAGALIRFSDGNGMGTTPYSKRIYGSNVGVEKTVSGQLNRPALEITLPVYGMAYTDRGLAFLAEVESGSEAAEIMAYPAGVITEFNWAAAHFTLREQYIAQTTRTLGLNRRETNAYLRDMTVRFYILSGEEASYAGMARRYRSALEERNALASADTTYRPRVDILGAESSRFLLWNSVETMTTLQQARELLSAYAEAGLHAPLVVYRGWQPGGLSYSLGSGDMRMDRRLGDRGELSVLANELAEQGGKLLLEIDPVRANPGRMYNMRLDIVRTIGQTVAEVPTGKDLYPNLYYLTPSRSADVLADAASVWGDAVDGLAVVGMPNILYSYFSNGSNHSRGDTASAYAQALAGADASLALSNPLALYFDQMDIYLDMPLTTTSYSFLSEAVPFLPMVLSGHVPYYSTWANFESNQRTTLLSMVEYGAFPSYLVTGNDVQALTRTNSSDVFTAQWQVMQPILLETDAVLSALHEQLAGAVLVDHAILSQDVVRCTYDNGTEVYVNYRKTPYRVDGHLLDAQGYLVVEGGTMP